MGRTAVLFIPGQLLPLPDHGIFAWRRSYDHAY